MSFRIDYRVPQIITGPWVAGNAERLARRQVESQENQAQYLNERASNDALYAGINQAASTVTSMGMQKMASDRQDTRAATGQRYSLEKMAKGQEYRAENIESYGRNAIARQISSGQNRASVAATGLMPDEAEATAIAYHEKTNLGVPFNQAVSDAGVGRVDYINQLNQRARGDVAIESGATQQAYGGAGNVASYNRTIDKSGAQGSVSRQWSTGQIDMWNGLTKAEERVRNSDQYSDAERTQALATARKGKQDILANPAEVLEGRKRPTLAQQIKTDTERIGDVIYSRDENGILQFHNAPKDSGPQPQRQPPTPQEQIADASRKVATREHQTSFPSHSNPNIVHNALSGFIETTDPKTGKVTHTPMANQADYDKVFEGYLAAHMGDKDSDLAMVEKVKQAHIDARTEMGEMAKSRITAYKDREDTWRNTQERAANALGQRAQAVGQQQAQAQRGAAMEQSAKQRFVEEAYGPALLASEGAMTAQQAKQAVARDWDIARKQGKTPQIRNPGTPPAGFTPPQPISPQQQAQKLATQSGYEAAAGWLSQQVQRGAITPEQARTARYYVGYEDTARRMLNSFNEGGYSRAKDTLDYAKKIGAIDSKSYDKQLAILKRMNREIETQRGHRSRQETRTER